MPPRSADPTAGLPFVRKREVASQVHGTLKRVSDELVTLTLQQSGEGHGDDDLAIPPFPGAPEGKTYAQRRAELEDKAANIRRDFAGVMPLVERIEKREADAEERALAEEAKADSGGDKAAPSE